MHYFPGLDEHTVLWKMTYTNLGMYLATIPSYESEAAEGEDDKPAPVVSTSGNTTAARERQAIRDFFKNT